MKKIYTQNFFATQSMPISHSGDSLQYFLPLKISCPKKRPFCDFSVFVLFYGLFRNTVPALPIMYKFLSLLGLIRFCTIICIFSDYVSAGVDFSILLYRGTRAYMRIVFRFCLYFVHFRKYDTKIAICVLL